VYASASLPAQSVTETMPTRAARFASHRFDHTTTFAGPDGAFRAVYVPDANNDSLHVGHHGAW